MAASTIGKQTVCTGVPRKKWLADDTRYSGKRDLEDPLPVVAYTLIDACDVASLKKDVLASGQLCRTPFFCMTAEASRQGAVDCQYFVLAEECNVATRQGVCPVIRPPCRDIFVECGASIGDWWSRMCQLVT